MSCFGKQREEQEHGGQPGTKGKCYPVKLNPLGFIPRLWHHGIPESQIGLVGRELKSHPVPPLPWQEHLPVSSLAWELLLFVLIWHYLKSPQAVSPGGAVQPMSLIQCCGKAQG